MKYKINILVTFITKSQGDFCNNCSNKRAKQIYMKKRFVNEQKYLGKFKGFGFSSSLRNIYLT